MTNLQLRYGTEEEATEYGSDWKRNQPILLQPSQNKTESLFRGHILFKSQAILNKFVRTKMRPKEGTKIELQREICQILSDLEV